MWQGEEQGEEGPHVSAAMQQAPLAARFLLLPLTFACIRTQNAHAFTRHCRPGISSQLPSKPRNVSTRASPASMSTMRLSAFLLLIGRTGTMMRGRSLERWSCAELVARKRADQARRGPSLVRQLPHQDGLKESDIGSIPTLIAPVVGTSRMSWRERLIWLPGGGGVSGYREMRVGGAVAFVG